MGHVNNAAYIDYVEEALLASGDAAVAAMRALPRRVRIEYVQAAVPRVRAGRGGVAPRRRRRRGLGVAPDRPGRRPRHHARRILSGRRVTPRAAARRADPRRRPAASDRYLWAMTGLVPPRCVGPPRCAHRRALGPSPHGRYPYSPAACACQVHPTGDRTATDHAEASWTPLTAALALALVIALIGALAGAAGFALLDRRAAEPPARPDRGAPRARRRRRPDAPRGRAAGSATERLRAAFSELADRVAQTWEQATFDPLTGIANRQTVLTRVEEELARAARYRRPLSLILVDLDHFKRFNDSHGHAAGDVILRQVAQLLAANVRAVDLAGRYGGEEFLVVLPETDPDAAASLAEKLRRIIGGAEIRLPDNEVVSVTLQRRGCRRPGRGPAARRAGARRGRRAVLGQGAGPQPGLRVPRDRRRRHDPPRADHRRGARPRHRRRQGRDGRRAGRADRHARGAPGVGAASRRR